MLTAILFASLVGASTPTPVSSATSCPTSEVEWTHSFRPGTEAGKSFDTVGTVSSAALVTVNPDGSVKSVVLKESSHYGDVDAYTISEATNGIYKPKTINCQPVEGTYLFRITFARVD